MVNIWKYSDYDGVIKIITNDGYEYIGNVFDVEDIDENAGEDDCLVLYVGNVIFGINQKDIKEIIEME